jgi:acyl-CoA hydrolase
MPRPTELVVTLALSTDEALRKRYMVIDEPVQGNVRFGLMLEVLDKLAEEAALAYVRESFPDARVVTAAIDNIYIRNAANVQRDLVFGARINFVGRTSMEVGIRADHPATATEPAAHIASCYFTMVARSTAGEGALSLVLPTFQPTDALGERRWQRAIARREAYRKGLQQAQEPPSRDEYAQLSELHAAQDQPGFEGLLADRCATESWDRTYPEHENVPEKIFGGHLIRRAYEQSSICAEEVAPNRPVIVAVNRINFVQPVRMGDKLHLVSRAVYSGDCSVCVETDIMRISRDRKQINLSNACIFTFVNVDDDLRPQAVPCIHPTNYKEDASYLAAHRRRLEHVRLMAAKRGKA